LRRRPDRAFGRTHLGGRHRRGRPGRPRRTPVADRPTRRRCGSGSGASGSTRAWSRSVRASASGPARVPAGDRCSRPRSEETCPGPRRSIGAPRTLQGLEGFGHKRRQTLACRAAERRPHEPQRLHDVLAVDLWPRLSSRLGPSRDRLGKSLPGMAPCPTRERAEFIEHLALLALGAFLVPPCLLLRQRSSLRHRKTHRAPSPGRGGPWGASALRGHPHVRQWVRSEDISGESTRALVAAVAASIGWNPEEPTRPTVPSQIQEVVACESSGLPSP
jgi:hypothetical protein